MARPSNHRIFLTLEEYSWVIKMVARKADIAKKSIKDKKLRDMVIAFADKVIDLPAQPEPNGEYILKTNRAELRFLQEVSKNTHAVLVATVVPEYMKRAEDGKEGYKMRYYKALAQSEMLVSLRNKIEKML